MKSHCSYKNKNMKPLIFSIFLILVFCQEQLGAQQTAPTITCPADITTIACASYGTAVYYNTPGIDNPDDYPIVSLIRIQGPPSGAIFPVGTTTVAYRLTYKCGLFWVNTCSTICTFTVHVDPPPNTYYVDFDKDGYGSSNSAPVQACTAPLGYVEDNTDCNDNDRYVHAPITYYKDQDGDGFGNSNNPISLCVSLPPIGYVSNKSDCDDTKKLYADSDGDGYGAGVPVACGVTDNTDCNDGEFSVHAPITYYKDQDEDGFGDPNNAADFCSSTAPAGYVSDNSDCDDNKLLYTDNDGDGFGTGSPVACGTANSSDCNDNSFAINPETIWVFDADGDGYYNDAFTGCDGLDGYVIKTNQQSGDCNDKDVNVHTPIQYYVDADKDGYGSTTTAMVCSSVAQTGYSTNNTDCDDNDGTKHASYTFYPDTDGDSYGSGSTVSICAIDASTPPAGYSINNTDCAPGDGTKWKSALFYVDSDGDGYTNGTATVCYGQSVPAGYRINTLGNDCDDSRASIHPGATEVCANGIDDNCNGLTDENCGSCGTVSSLSTTGISATSATLNWTASVNPTQWQVQYKSTIKGAKWVDALVVGSARSVTLSKLLPGQIYQWQIRALCDKKWTLYSGPITFKTTAATLTATAPSSVTIAETPGKEAQTLEVKAKPNPSHTNFRIAISSNNKTEPVKVLVTDMLGRAIEGSAAAVGQRIIIGDKYRVGTYIVTIIQGKDVKALKLIKLSN
jgi:hypothetical protein